MAGVDREQRVQMPAAPGRHAPRSVRAVPLSPSLSDPRFTEAAPRHGLSPARGNEDEGVSRQAGTRAHPARPQQWAVGGPHDRCSWRPAVVCFVSF